MKTIKIKLIVLFLLSFLFFQCNNNFLERYPLDSIGNENYWNTENDISVYNNGLYNIARSSSTVPLFLCGHDEAYSSADGSYLLLDYFSDNTVPGIRHEIFKDHRAGIHTVPPSPISFGYSGWNFVRAINIGLENYDKADIAQSVKNKYAGEARLLRGWFYAEKVSKFGDVPWIDHELNIDSEELSASRTPREEVMGNVLTDLNFACENLPDDWGESPGRLNRWCALLVKSRVCLFEGTWQKYHNGTNAGSWLQEAANAAEELIKDGPYSVYSTGNPEHDYNAYHCVTNLTGNSEVMYWRKYVKGIVTHRVRERLCAYRGNGATKSFVEDYLCTDGLPISLSPLYKGDEIYENIFENRDPRLRQTILYPSSILPTDSKDYTVYQLIQNLPYPRLAGMGGQYSPTGYHIIKYMLCNASLDRTQDELAGIILRFGEALLNYAEAKAELGTISQEDLDISINKLRDRVAMPHMTLNPPMDPRYADDGVSALIIEIRRERRIELFNEGFRYNDLRRWKQGKKLATPNLGMRWDQANRSRFDPDGKSTAKTTTVNGIEYVDPMKGSQWANPVFDENKHYLWPIPLSAISQNPNVSQNPGWE